MVIILTGPAAAGKNTIGRLIAENRERCAVIDVDQVRWMLLHPHKAPWDGEEGHVQRLLGVKNTCLLTKSFSENNCDVVILDVLSDETAKLYKEELNTLNPKIVLLLPTYEEILKRFRQRPPTITEDEAKMVYKWQEDLTVFDEKIDNTSLSAEATLNKILFTH